MKYITWIAATIGGVVLLGLLGLAVKPSQFAAPARVASPKPVRLVPIPAGLPAPVERWYRAEFPQGLPVYDTVVMRGTGTMRIAGVGLPFRHVVEVRPGRGFYRKMDITWMNIAFLHGLDTFVDGTGVMNTPVGRVDGPKIDQGANVDQLARAARRSGRTCREPSGSLGAHRRRTQRDWSSRSRTRRTASSSGSTRRPAIRPPRAPTATARPIPPRRQDGSQR